LVLLYIPLRWHYTLAIPFFILAVLTGGFVATLYVGGYIEGLLEALGRDATLTGRTQLWNAVLSMIWQRPWLGYGYAAFWQGWEGEESAHVLLWMMAFGGGQYYGAADNGYLQLWLDLGLVGVMLFACQFLLTFSRSIAWARRTKTVEGFWPLTFLVALLVINYGESVFLDKNSITTTLYVYAALYMAARSSLVMRTFGPGDVRPTGATSKWVSPLSRAD
jgi:O-antigen ligase